MLGCTLSNRWISCRIAAALTCKMAGCLYGELDDPRRGFIVVLFDQRLSLKQINHITALPRNQISGTAATTPDIHLSPA